ncbi:MAG: hypothetical protein EP324_08170 [Gammaproteobacteria bacterium]|nr:MAG: hypothetical protein EP324_08170 [Gammaproteobacteria bacterium]
MDMGKKIIRPPLTAAEVEEKKRLRAAINRHKGQWELENGVDLTQSMLGQAAAEVIGRESAFSQGAIWQYLSEGCDTKLNPEFVQAVAKLLKFPVEDISPRFRPIVGALGVDLVSADGLDDPDIQESLRLMLKGTPAQRKQARQMIALLLDEGE